MQKKPSRQHSDAMRSLYGSEVNEMDKMWYAVQLNADDDWGWGSFDWDEAVEMLKAQGQGMIATINDENKVCEDVTYYEDIF